MQVRTGSPALVKIGQNRQKAWLFQPNQTSWEQVESD